MALTDLDNVTSLIQQFWSPNFMDELRQTNLLFNLCNREYEGDIKEAGNAVVVNQVNALTGSRTTIDGAGGGYTFTTETLSTSTATIIADQRFTAGIEYHDLVAIQSMIDPTGRTATDVRAAMLAAINNQMNTWLYGLITASQTIPSVTNMSGDTVADARQIAGEQKWGYNKRWYGLLAPKYHTDLLKDEVLTSKDYVGDDLPVINGQIGLPRYGFFIYEDNTQVVSATGGGLFFHPDFLYLVAQYEPRFKISDLHAVNKFGFNFTVDLVAGAKMGIQGDKRNIKVQSGP